MSVFVPDPQRVIELYSVQKQLDSVGYTNGWHTCILVDQKLVRHKTVEKCVH